MGQVYRRISRSQSFPQRTLLTVATLPLTKPWNFWLPSNQRTREVQKLCKTRTAVSRSVGISRRSSTISGDINQLHSWPAADSRSLACNFMACRTRGCKRFAIPASHLHHLWNPTPFARNTGLSRRTGKNFFGQLYHFGTVRSGANGRSCSILTQKTGSGGQQEAAGEPKSRKPKNDPSFGGSDSCSVVKEGAAPRPKGGQCVRHIKHAKWLEYKSGSTNPAVPAAMFWGHCQK